jgi:bacillolysin
LVNTNVMRPLFLFLVSIVFTSAFAQTEQSNFTINRIHPKTGLPYLITVNSTGFNSPNAENLDFWIQNNLNANSQFRLKYKTVLTSRDSKTHMRFQQYYGKYPVESGEVILHLKSNKATHLSGMFFPNLNLNSVVNISKESAIQIALADYQNAVFMWEIPEEENILKWLKKNDKATYFPNPELMFISTGDSFKNSDFRLAYKVDVYASEPHQREWIYIDAENGEIVDREDQICTIHVEGTAHTRYHGIHKITCDSIRSDSFELFDSQRGQGIRTTDVKIIGLDSGSREFTDSDGIWNNVNKEQDEVASDVHWGSEMTYDYFKNFHNRLSYDDSDGFILSKVHFGNKYNNANWNGSFARYGDGDGISYSPLTSIDVVAHELTHGVTRTSSNLRYKDESGALNESFSDIFGKTIEYYSDSANFNWLMGDKFSLKNLPFRDMSFPLNRNHPKYYEGEKYYTGSLDNGGVHINSGVQNYWYYLLTEGGSGIRETDSMPFEVKKIGFEKAGQIAYLNLTAYLYRDAFYEESCYFAIQSAIDIFGEGSFEVGQVKNAWYAVGFLSREELSTPNLNNQKSKWSVFPNPSNQTIQISNPSVFQEVNIELIDYTGKSIQKTRLSPNQKLDISSLANGVYFIRINNTMLKWIKA